MNEEKEKKENDTQKNIMDIIKKSRIIHLNDPIDKDSAGKTNKALLMMDEISNDPIKLFINSPGGEVNAGFFIFDCIKFIRSPVYIIGAGLVASAAALIYLSVEKEYRLSLPHARYLLHQPMSGSRGVVSDLEIHAREVENLKQLINTIIAEATDNPLKKIEKDTDRDFWLNPIEAQAYGMVGTIITHKDDFEKIFPHPKKTPASKKKSTSNIKTNATKKPVSKKPAKKTSTKKPPKKS